MVRRRPELSGLLGSLDWEHPLGLAKLRAKSRIQCYGEFLSAKKKHSTAVVLVRVSQHSPIQPPSKGGRGCGRGWGQYTTHGVSWFPSSFYRSSVAAARPCPLSPVRTCLYVAYTDGTPRCAALHRMQIGDFYEVSTRVGGMGMWVGGICAGWESWIPRCRLLPARVSSQVAHHCTAGTSINLPLDSP